MAAMNPLIPLTAAGAALIAVSVLMIVRHHQGKLFTDPRHKRMYHVATIGGIVIGAFAAIGGATLLALGH